MNYPRSAVHRTVIVVDVEGFGSRHRTNSHQLAVRDGLYRGVREAFDEAGISWAECYHEDRGDGIFILAPADVPKGLFVEALPHALVAALRAYNDTHEVEEQIRLRVALHAGEVAYDEHGVTAASINLTFRLLDAPPFKVALAESPGVLALITSDWFFDEVVRHSPDVDPATYRPSTVVVKETTTVGWICLPDHPYSPDVAYLTAVPRNAVLPVPRQLPAAPRGFIGRAAELAALTAALDTVADQDVALVVTAVRGVGGVGKTWLALQWAHRHMDRFPDGQLFVDLRGFTPSGEPVGAAAAVRGFLDALGLDPKSIPEDLDAQAALYRSIVADRRMLIVLDNARDTAQVASLLPGGRACVVIVTSRHHLAGLATAHGARSVTLDMLDEPEARAALTQYLGTSRCDAEPAATTELLTYCAGYPLALRIVAHRAASHPHFPLSALAGELRDEATRLGVLDDDDPTASLPAVLSWSYAALSPKQARVFRLLGLVPGPDISLPAAASLAGVPAADASATLRALESASLIQEYTPGRYRMHDLVQLQAVEQAHRVDSADVRENAMRRLVGFYLHTAHAGERVLGAQRVPIDLGRPVSGCCPLTQQDLAATMAWFDSEYDCLTAIEHKALELQWHSDVWHFARALETFRLWRGHRHDQYISWRAGLAASQHLDAWRIAFAHRNFGVACARAGRHNEALGHLQQAIVLNERANDALGLAICHMSLARTWELQENYQLALTHARQSLQLFRQFEAPVYQADMLSAIGLYLARLGDYRNAYDASEAALALVNPQYRHGEANILDSLGYIASRTGQYLQARDYYERALVIRRTLGSTYDEAGTLDGLGQTNVQLGRPTEARHVWRQALDLYETQHRESESRRLETRLVELGDAGT
jgi:tetratricopeptide (TPR) repeat protein